MEWIGVVESETRGCDEREERGLTMVSDLLPIDSHAHMTNAQPNGPYHRPHHHPNTLPDAF